MTTPLLQRDSSRVAHALTSRRGAWLTLVIGVLLALGVIGALQGTSAPAGSDAAPVASESTRAARLAEQFPDSDLQPVLVVASRQDGSALTATDLARLTDLAARLEMTSGREPSPPSESTDHKAAVIQVPVRVGPDNTANADTVRQLRDTIAAHAPDDLTVQVTGGVAFGADIASAFDGADVTLLLVTIAIVALLLLLTYRSPVLFLVPLTVVGLADQVAAVVTKGLGQAFDLQFDAGVVSVLVFGAGTNYALLLISRYREHLRHTADHRAALADAWRATVPAVAASNLTVVLALLSLVLAVIPGTRGLGIAGAVGLLIAAVAVLTLLPAALSLTGRWVFWPFVPATEPSDAPSAGGRNGQAVGSRRHAADGPSNPWERIARRVTRRPVAVLLTCVALLAVMAAGLLDTKVGLDQADRFRVPSESAAGLEVLAEHFPAGEAAPITVIAAADRIDAVATAAAHVKGVESVHPAGTTSGTDPLARLVLTGEPAPGTDAALDLVRGVRAAVHAVPDADAVVGGQPAVDLDARDGNHRDLLVVAPLILAIAALVLFGLLRSVVAPIVLLVTNLASALAAIGAGSWLARRLFDAPALDLQVPLFAFLFLVALGIDYTIFLVHRAHSEAATHGTREGVVRAVASTGGVITSAGVVLAAVFAALGVLPLVTLGQLGLIVGLGVLVDTLLVRTVVVPALFALLGDRIWWPSRPAAAPAQHLPAVRETAVSTLQ
ncbi:MMPL family transporter [Intrasporangium sp.]|uniref:MMPL family transporter n=1 Tax=Intrasporangium sp. TaxID=1925024 RepID=UPI0032214CB1